MRRSSCARNTKTIRLENEGGAKIKAGSREPKRALRVARQRQELADKSSKTRAQRQELKDKSSKTEPKPKKKSAQTSGVETNRQLNRKDVETRGLREAQKSRNLRPPNKRLATRRVRPCRHRTLGGVVVNQSKMVQHTGHGLRLLHSVLAVSHGAKRALVRSIAIATMLGMYAVTSIGSMATTTVGVAGLSGLALSTTATPANARRRWRRRRHWHGGHYRRGYHRRGYYRGGYYGGWPYRRRRRRRGFSLHLHL